MSDFLTFAREFGLPLAMTFVAVGVLARALVAVSRDKDRANEARVSEMQAQYEHRIEDLTQDRDWHRDRLYQVMGTSETQNVSLEELIRRVANQLPPPPPRGREHRGG